MKLISVAILLLMWVGSVHARASRLQTCDEVGTVARVIAEKRDAGVSADVLRKRLDAARGTPDWKAVTDVLISQIYSRDSQELSPEDIAARVMDSCLSYTDDN